MSHPNSSPDPLSPELLQEIGRIPEEVEREMPHLREQTRLQSILYLIPFAGFVPAIWTLYRSSPRGDRSRRRGREAAQLAVSTGGVWAIATVLLTLGGSSGENIGINTLVLASLLTSGYFLTNVWLMTQVLRRQRVYLPGLSEVGQRLMDPRRKHRP
ncbi:MAG: hypothetical protein ACO3NK_08900 [Prochlorotrichaceae cyanobacterium]|jgi:hypothetical protein